MIHSQKCAILYDAIEKYGGAESVISTLMSEFSEYELVTSYINLNRDLFQSNRLRTLGGPLYIPGAKQIMTWRLFEQKTRFLTNYQTVLFSGFCSLGGVRNRPEGPNIYYCHTPPRFLYDLNSYYLSQLGRLRKEAFKAMCNYLKPKFENAICRMDITIANSNNVQRRLREYLGRDSQVLYPPVRIDKYKWLDQGDYYLSTARLESYKRVDLVVKAFLTMPHKRLIVASGGRQLKSLRALAKNVHNIKFTNWCTPQQLQELVGNAIATIYIPINEDFGISPVESLSAGKPVIGVAEGGLLETVKHETTGLLIPPENIAVESLRGAVETMTKPYATSLQSNCTRASKRFSKEIFVSEMRRLIYDRSNV